MTTILEHTETLAPPHTLAEYLTMPEGQPYYEFINGIAHFIPSPTTTHQRILRRICCLMDSFVETRGLGEVLFAPLDVYLSDEEYYQPDMLYVSNPDFKQLCCGCRTTFCGISI